MVAFQNKIPGRLLTSEEYCTLLGSGTRAEGCRPIPNTAGTWDEPGRDRARERKRDAGAGLAPVTENRLEAHAAPSASLPTTGGMSVAMMEFSGSARPRIPLKLGPKSSLSTTFAAAGFKVSLYSGKRTRTYQMLDSQSNSHQQTLCPIPPVPLLFRPGKG